MIATFNAPRIWHQLNEDLQKNLEIPSNENFQIFKSFPFALSEVFKLLAHQFPQKKRILCLKGMSKSYQFYLPLLYKEGFDIVFIEPHELLEEPSTQKNMAKITDVLALLYCGDDPLTGCCYDLPERILNYFQSQRCFQIEISHKRHRYHSKSLGPFSLQLQMSEGFLCGLRGGPRWRSTSLLSALEYWPSETLQQTLPLFSPLKESPVIIEKIKALLTPLGLGEIYIPPFPHLMDRILFYHKDFGGEWIEKQLLKKFPHHENAILSTQSCGPRWRSKGYFENEIIPPEMLPQLLVLSVDVLIESGFVEVLEKIVSH